MSPPTIDDFLPSEPDWHVDWRSIEEAFAWIRKLRGVTQDPRHHAEGPVDIHVRMVVEEMAASASYRARNEDERLVLFAAALLHDVCKPETWARESDGSITHHGHSRMGAFVARRILWRAGFPFALRERVCSAILAHQVPFWLLDRPHLEARRLLLETSLGCGNDILAALAAADARGRICEDRGSIIENVDLFSEAADDEGCLRIPYPFFNDHTRVRYFLSPETMDPAAELFDTTHPAFTVTLMSGMPASGKSSWIERETSSGGLVQGQPVVSMDRLRAEMKVSPGDNQGRVRQAALKRAREHLAARRSFVWDAVNLDRQRRIPLAALCHDYGARLRMVYVETSEDEMRARNRARDGRLPDGAIDGMLRHWDPPTLSECHDLVIDVSACAHRPGMPGSHYRSPRL